MQLEKCHFTIILQLCFFFNTSLFLAKVKTSLLVIVVYLPKRRLINIDLYDLFTFISKKYVELKELDNDGVLLVLYFFS